MDAAAPTTHKSKSKAETRENWLGRPICALPFIALILLTQPPLDDDRSIVMCDICFGTEGSGTALLFVDNVLSGSCQYRESVVACLPGVRKGPSSLVSNMSERDVTSSHTKPIQTALESGAPILWGAMRE